MTRLNIEDHAFCDPRLLKLAREIRKGNFDLDDLSHFAALGMLAILWHETQSEMKISITKTECELLLLDNISECLIKTQYLKPDGEKLKVVGNEHQIAALEKFGMRQRAAAKKRWEKKSNDLDAGGMPEDAGGMPDQCKTPKSDAKNAQDQDQDQDQDQEQLKRELGAEKNKIHNAPPPPALAIAQLALKGDLSIHDEPVETALVQTPIKSTSRVAKALKTPKPDKKENQTWAIWEAYRDSMKSNWGLTLEPASRLLKECKNLLETINFESALEVARYYPSRRKDWYIKTGHNPKYMVQDAVFLLGEIQTGLKKIAPMIKDISSTEQSNEYNKQKDMGFHTSLLTATPEQLDAYEAQQKKEYLEAHPEIKEIDLQ